MPIVKFGTKDEPSVELVESPDMIAVRTRTQRPVRGVGPVAQPPVAAVADGTLVAAFPSAGVEVYRVPTKVRTLNARKLALRAAPDVRFAGSVLVYPGTQEPVIYTENLYIRFREHLDADECAAIVRAAGLTVKEKLDYATNAFCVQAPEGTGQRIFDIALKLLAREDVVYCHPELIQERRHKLIFPQQWHLKAATINNVVVQAHANVEAAHLVTRGANVTIAVIDDGIDIDHPEFAAPGKVVAPRDVTQQTNDPRPKAAHENHGTACAGVACAGGVLGASGVAPLARLIPIRLADGLGSMQEAKAFRWAADNGADVISCSWGPADGQWWNPADPVHTKLVSLPASTRDALEYVFANGRGGKGCVVFFAAGNGNESTDFDGYAGFPKVIAVAACNDRSKRSVYSDFGKAVWCSFPSNDMGHPPFNHPNPLTTGIWTTDRLGSNRGYNPGSLQFGDAAGVFTNDFGGTSSACPGAAGVAALVLSANANLQWTQVKEILRRACDPIDPTGGNYDANGHSHSYGYGRLNALTAVTLAQGAIGRLLVVNKLLNEPIPDLGRIEGTLDITDPTPSQKLAVSVRLTHTYIGDLVITVLPPPGSGMPPVTLHNRAGGDRDNLDKLFDPSNTPRLAEYIGKNCSGRWTIRVEDKSPQDAGRLLQIGIQLSLPPASTQPPVAPPRLAAGPPTTSSPRAPSVAKTRRTTKPRTVAKKPNQPAKRRTKAASRRKMNGAKVVTRK